MTHPYFFDNHADCVIARSQYHSPEPAFRYREPRDFQHYIDFVHVQLRELLTQYGPIAGMWFDPIMPYYGRHEMFPVQDTYTLIRSLQPHCLIAYKQGATGTVDFASGERDKHSLEGRLTGRSAQVAHDAWEANKDKYGEICDTMQPKVWGYNRNDSGQHLNAAALWERLENVARSDCNLLMNTGPLLDGSIDPEDEQVLREG